MAKARAAISCSAGGRLPLKLGYWLGDWPGAAAAHRASVLAGTARCAGGFGRLVDYLSKIDGQSGRVVLDRVIDEHGPLASPEQVPETTLATLTGRVPDLMIDFWRFHGTGWLNGGRLRICLPGEFRNVLEMLFEGDPDFGADCHAIAIGAFGDLAIWSERHWLTFLRPVAAALDAPFLLTPRAKDDPDNRILEGMFQAHPLFWDLADSDGQPLFERAERELGSIRPDGIYGPMPLPFDGPIVLDALQRVPAAEYLDALRQTTIVTLADFNAGRFNLRDIGGRR